MTVPVVGALLIFTLMIGPPAAARCFTDRTERAMLGSVVITLLTVWGWRLLARMKQIGPLVSTQRF